MAFRAELNRSLKCRYCERHWPPEDEFQECPVCREPTIGTSTDPLPPDEVELERKIAAFGWWLYYNDRI